MSQRSSGSQRTPVTEDERLLAQVPRERRAFVKTDSWRVLRIMGEFVEGFDTLSDVYNAVTVFGSARTTPDDPYYEKAVETARMLAQEGFPIITGGGPGIMEAANRGAQEGNGLSIGCNIELPFEQALNQLPLLFRPQDDVRQVLDRIHRLPGRIRDDGRAVRGAHADSDREGEQLPRDPVRSPVLGRSRGVAERPRRGGGQDRHHRSPALHRYRQPAGGRRDRTAGAGAPQPSLSDRDPKRRGGAMTTRKDFLRGQRIDPKPITGRETVPELVDNAFLAYNSGRLAEGCRLFTELMLEDDVTVGMSLTGAMTPAGLGMSTIIPLLEAGFIDWIVST